MLVANALGGSITDPLSLRLFWSDPSTGNWVPLATAVNANFDLTSRLSHFSKYAGGKAGW